MFTAFITGISVFFVWFYLIYPHASVAITIISGVIAILIEMCVLYMMGGENNEFKN